MSMLTAMYSGVNGLNSHGRALSTVADNIANVSTHGFKASRVNFGDMMMQSLTVGGNVVQQGGTGARILNVQSLMTQGSFETTDMPTDLAVNGSGFFQVSQAGNGADAGGLFYTRAGQFSLDKEGYMVNPLGYRLRGYNLDENGEILPIVEDLRIVAQQVDAIPTTEVDLSVNLNSEEESLHHASQPIDPTDQETWDYLSTMRTYDSLGVAHDLSLFFQRLDVSTYSGSLPTGSDPANPVDPSDITGLWKVTTFENVDGTFTNTDNVQAPKTYYMAFDTNGHLVGTTSGLPASGDEYVQTSSVAATNTPATAAGATVSDRLGEQLSFTANGTTQTYISEATIDFTGTPNFDVDSSAGETLTITIGTTAISLPDGVGYTAVTASNYVVNQINADSSLGYYARSDGAGQITLYSKGGSSTYDLSVDNRTAAGTLTTDDEINMQELVTSLNAGDTAKGGLRIDWGSLTDGNNGTDPNASTITITHPTLGAQTFTYDTVLGGVGNNFANMAQLEAAIDAAWAPNTDIQSSFNASDTNNLYLDYGTTGTAGNATTLATNDSAAVILASSTLMGGRDDSTVTMVSATADAVGSTNFALNLARNDSSPSSTSTITIASSNTLGDGLSINFDSWTQETWANNGEVGDGAENLGRRTITFMWQDESGSTEPQEILFNFKPTGTGASTQSAGSSETFYLYQDGTTRGALEAMDIDRTGVITGTFSNGTLRTLGAVVLVNFADAGSLDRAGENLWRQTINSGEPVINYPGQGGLGTVESAALEQSNVDLADELVKMIAYQRAYQANSKTISTTDQLLQELINLKR